MAKVTYASLKLKTNTNVNTINFNGNQIEVLQYLPIEEKYSLVNITLAQAKDEDIFNPIKKDTEFKATIGGFITDLLKDIPEQIKNLQKIMDKFDPNKFNELIAFSKAINAGKDIE